MKVIIGSDHGGFLLKETIKHWLEMNDHKTTDVGCFSKDSVDYPEYAREVATRVAASEFDRGILICGTGVGMCIVANKVTGIRAALCNDLYCARHSRMHNDANVLTIGGRVVGSAYALEIVSTFLSTKFDGGRHRKRVTQIMEMEKSRGKK